MRKEQVKVNISIQIVRKHSPVETM